MKSKYLTTEQLSDLYRRGMISPTVVENQQVKKKFDQLKGQGLKATEAVKEISQQINKTERTVWRKIKKNY